MNLILILQLLGTISISSGFDRFLCETDAIDGKDPTVGFRVGRLFQNGECQLINNDGYHSNIDLDNDLTSCMMAPRRIAPECDSYWIFESGEVYNAANTAEDRFAVPFFPGGPGIGGSPFRDVGGAIACPAAYPDLELSTENIDLAAEYLCGNENDFTPLSGTKCTITPREATAIPGSDVLFEYTLTDQDCNNDGVPKNVDDCVPFLEWFGVAGTDCERRIIADAQTSTFGFEWKNIQVPQPANQMRAIEISYLCGDFENAGYEHTVCSVSADKQSDIKSKTSDLGDDFVQKYYRFEKRDCSNKKLPKDSDCVTIIRSTIYCCEYSFNFKAIGPKELIDGVRGPAITWQIWKNNQDDESLCENNIPQTGPVIEVDYLCKA